jgi:N-acyl-D-amino-acid deacylase
MWQSTLTVLYPKRNFTDRAETEFILRDLAGPDDLLLARFDPKPEYVGKTVGEIARLRHEDPATTLMALIALAGTDGSRENVVGTSMAEPDIARILRWPFANVCTDGELHGSHPRGFGAFPRVLGKYVREQQVIALEEAVRKMTSLAAANVGLRNRGTIVAGNHADLVLFDPKTVADRATLKEPHLVSTGVDTVWVNGQIVFADGKATGRRPGRVLRRAASRN